LDEVEDNAQLNSTENVEQNNIVDGEDVVADFDVDAFDEGDINIETTMPP
jgi:hypothetical protein